MTRQVEKLHLERSFEATSEDESLKRKRKLRVPDSDRVGEQTDDYDSEDLNIPRHQQPEDENLH